MIMDGIFSLISVISLIGLVGCAACRILSVKKIQTKLMRGLIVIRARKQLANKAELFVIRSFGQDLLISVTATNLSVLARSKVPSRESHDPDQAPDENRRDFNHEQ